MADKNNMQIRIKYYYYPIYSYYFLTRHKVNINFIELSLRVVTGK